MVARSNSCFLRIFCLDLPKYCSKIVSALYIHRGPPGLAPRHGEGIEAGGDDEECDGGDGAAVSDVAGGNEGGGRHHEAQEGVELADGDGPPHPAAPPRHVCVPA